jgi:DNA-binding HxlR family transcriptional regulator
MTPIDFNGLDSAVHAPVRLGVLALLQLGGPLDFTSLKKRLNVTDGVLGAHLLKLEESGYIACRKSFVGRRPKSTYRLLAAGRSSLAKYLYSMRQLIDAVAASVGK